MMTFQITGHPRGYDRATGPTTAALYVAGYVAASVETIAADCKSLAISWEVSYPALHFTGSPAPTEPITVRRVDLDYFE